jgi:hypothetical protein
MESFVLAHTVDHEICPHAVAIRLWSRCPQSCRIDVKEQPILDFTPVAVNKRAAKKTVSATLSAPDADQEAPVPGIV